MQKILLLTPKGVEVKEIEEVSLEIMQECVGGYIEFVPVDSLEKRRIDVFCNADGKFKGLPLTMYLLADGKIYDVVAGNVLFCGHDGEGDSIGLKDSDIDFLKEHLENHAILAGCGMLPFLSQEDM